ncbi:MAG TPA: hypothetical protein VFQ12_03505 [Thermoleophilaceae bacterium]|nr:hypothetical protein [Thermoleophilaceae bacterium]
MLFRRRFLDGIEAGTVTLAFRRWERPRVRAGTRLRTRAGVLEILAIGEVAPAEVTEADARRAGYASPAELLDDLPAREGPLYRVELRRAGPDPRVALRERADLSREELAELRRRLGRLDAAARQGPWTTAVLELIERRPEVRAADLAPELGRERLAFKRDVRKLKELGLTESLERGYRLSPRGRAVLASLREPG